MRPSRAYQIGVDQFYRRGFRGNAQAVSRLLNLFRELFRNSNQHLALFIGQDFLRFALNSVNPVHGETKDRATAAAAWLCRAQDATPDDGMSYGFFPCKEANGWVASYPETTGYIIPTLLDYAEQRGDQSIVEKAVRGARWEIDIQMDSGAVQGGIVCPPDKQSPAVFNTGMVLQGWSRVYRLTRDPVFLEAGRRASDFLLQDLTDEGYFKTNGQFVTPGTIKTYNCLCAWALFCFGEDAGDERYKRGAIKIVQAALKQQGANGWFGNNCLTNPQAPLLHTICYTLQGVLETGVLAKSDEFIDAATRGAAPLLPAISPKGFINGRFDQTWEPRNFSSCLTGAAQLAVIYYRLYELTRRETYQNGADQLVNYLKGLQVVNGPCEGVNGAIAGSFPLLGSYMTAGYPNWATKYFLDALLLQDRLGKEAVDNV